MSNSPSITLDMSTSKPLTSTVTLDMSTSKPLAAADGVDSTKPGWLYRYASNLWDQVNPVSALEGAGQAIRHPFDSIKAIGQAQEDVEKEAEQAFKRGDYGTGVAKVLDYLIPVIGPQLSKAGNQMASGDIAGGLGTTTGIAANIAGPEAVKGLVARLPVGELPERMYQSALKPSTTLNPAQRAAVVKEGLESNIPVSQEGLDKVGGLINDLNQKVQAAVSSQPNATVSPGAAMSKLPSVRAKFPFAPDTARVNQVGQEFIDQYNQSGAVRNMTPAEAQQMKVGLRRGVNYGEMGAPVAEARKALASGLKEELEKQFPEIGGLNAQESRQIGLQDELEKAVNRISNRNIIGLGGTILATGAGAAAGGPEAAMGAGLAAALIHKIVTDPMVQSKLAIALNKGSKGVALPAAQARVAAYASQLGNAINAAQSNEGQQSQ